MLHHYLQENVSDAPNYATCGLKGLVLGGLSGTCFSILIIQTDVCAYIKIHKIINPNPLWDVKLVYFYGLGQSSRHELPCRG